jgi:hypothetical protein
VSSRFSWSCHSYSRLPTNGRHLASSLSFLERFFVRPSIQPIADQREAHNAAIPNSQITDSPYFHPHSLWSYCSGASWVSSIGNGCCRLGRELNVAVSSKLVPGACRSHPNSAIWIHISLKLLLSSVPAVTFDSARVRTLHRLPTACEARFPTFAQLPQPLSSFLACRRVPPGAAPIA